MLKKWIDGQKAKRHFQKGIDWMASGQPGQSVAEFDRALALTPDFLKARLQRGIAHAVTLQDERSLVDLNAALAEDPELSAAYYWRSVIHLRREEIEPALENIQHAIALNAGEPANYLVRGFIHSHHQAYDLALSDMNTAIELGFEKDGLHNRALVYENMGYLVAALADWTEVIRLVPRDSTAYCKRGMLYAKTGQIEAAISDLKFGLQGGNQVSADLQEDTRKVLEELLVSHERPV